MAVNLTKNRLPLLAAYHDVISEESPTDWALYSYEDDTNDLTVASSGGGGLLDIVLHFDNQSVMYGFCSIKEASATLPRYILINWVGEDVPDARKCACASHVATIAEFLQGVDIIVNASSAEDIDPSAIAQRLSNGTIHVASPVLHRLRVREEENADNVGTTYQKTDAVLEMKQLNREQFWEQAKREEELRKEEEKQRALEERLKFEQERMEQERKEQEEREKRYQEREKQIEEHRKQQQMLEAEEAQKRLRDKSIFEDQEDICPSTKKTESEVEEAAAIIAQRADNPREFFKQQEKAVSTSFDSSPVNNRTGVSATSTGEDVFDVEVQRKGIASPASGEINGVDSSEKLIEFGLESHQHFREWQEETRPAERMEESPECFAEEFGPKQSNKVRWDDSLVQDAVPAPIGDAGPLRTIDLGFKDMETPNIQTDELQQQNESLLQLEAPAGSIQQAFTQQKTENILDLWESDSRHEPTWTSPEGIASMPTNTDLPSKQDGENVPMLVDFEEAPQLPEGFQLPPEGTVGALNTELKKEGSSSLVDDNLLNLDDLPEPPSTFCDMDQEENPPSIIDIEGPHQMTLSYQRALQEASDTLDSEPDFGELKESHTIANGEMSQKDGTQASEGYFSQSQEEEFHQPEESSAKIPPPPAFYNKPPEIDITCWDNDPVAEEEDFGAAD